MKSGEGVHSCSDEEVIKSRLDHDSEFTADGSASQEKMSSVSEELASSLLVRLFLCPKSRSMVSVFTHIFSLVSYFIFKKGSEKNTFFLAQRSAVPVTASPLMITHFT